MNLRKYMMGNNKDKDVVKYLRKLVDAGITVDCQIVLVRDVNDGKYLESTIRDLSALHPYLRSVAVVPVGLTKFRDKLADITPFDKESALDVVEQVTSLQDELYEKIKTRFIFIADEFYITSGKDFPSYEDYEEFDQLENGIGMCRLFEYEVEKYVSKHKNRKPCCSEVTIVTGVAAYDLIKSISEEIMRNIKIKITVEKIVNNFFGERITVSGLVTGKDIIEQLKNKDCKNIFMPRNMINDNGITLDDMTIEDLKTKLNANVTVCEVDGEAFLNSILV
jgi:putative radical SAM enzyme (TIGR03279 family)